MQTELPQDTLILASILGVSVFYSGSRRNCFSDIAAFNQTDQL
jgi:hypothetical protein